MSKIRVRLDHAGIAEAAQSAFSGLVQDKAGQIAGAIDAPTKVSADTNNDDLPVAVVTVTHPGALAMQAKHGILTRAASSAGVQVRRYAGG